MSDYFGYDVHFVMNVTDIDDKVSQMFLCRLTPSTKAQAERWPTFQIDHSPSPSARTIQTIQIPSSIVSALPTTDRPNITSMEILLPRHSRQSRLLSGPDRSEPIAGGGDDERYDKQTRIDGRKGRQVRESRAAPSCCIHRACGYRGAQSGRRLNECRWWLFGRWSWLDGCGLEGVIGED